MTLPLLTRPLGRALLVSVLLALAAGAVVAQKFEERSDVVAVEVPVNVVGRDGEPVRGLTAVDFEIFDGGDRQAITHF